MVDFRYHLVSIIAVFLALALGIVVGTTALNGRIPGDLDSRIEGLTDDKRELEVVVSDQRGVLDGDEEVLARTAAGFGDELDGRRVVVVSAPNAPAEQREQLVPVLELAGASVALQVQLLPDLIDPGLTGPLGELVDRVAPAGSPPEGEPVERAAQVLAAALLQPDGGPGPGAEAAGAVLEGFRDQDLIELEDEPGEPATLAVLLTGEPVGGADAEGTELRVEALLTMAAALDRAGDGAVVAGPVTAAEEGGLLRALHDSDLPGISSADGLERLAGSARTAYVLREQDDGGEGRYGTGDGADDGSLPSEEDG